MEKNPGVGDSSAKIRRQLIPPSSDRPLRNYEITTLLNYGSEEESDEEDALIAQPLVSRVSRMYMEEDEEVTEVNITLEWPPQLRRPSNSASTPASPTPVSPTPMEPSNKFKFDWRAFPMSQIEPRLRREPFSQTLKTVKM